MSLFTEAVTKNYIPQKFCANNLCNVDFSGQRRVRLLRDGKLLCCKCTKQPNEQPPEPAVFIMPHKYVSEVVQCLIRCNVEPCVDYIRGSGSDSNAEMIRQDEDDQNEHGEEQNPVENDSDGGDDVDQSEDDDYEPSPRKRRKFMPPNDVARVIVEANVAAAAAEPNTSIAVGSGLNSAAGTHGSEENKNMQVEILQAFTTIADRSHEQQQEGGTRKAVLVGKAPQLSADFYKSWLKLGIHGVNSNQIRGVEKLEDLQTSADLIRDSLAVYKTLSPKERKKQFGISKRSHSSSFSVKDVVKVHNMKPNHVELAFGIMRANDVFGDQWLAVSPRLNFDGKLKRMLRSERTMKLITATLKGAIISSWEAILQAGVAAP
jgi:hypothetical protein